MTNIFELTGGIDVLIGSTLYKFTLNWFPLNITDMMD